MHFSEQSQPLYSVPVRHNHETDLGPATFGPIFSHTVGSWWSGPALGMFCHEPNTWHQKIGSRFRAETGHRRSGFGSSIGRFRGVLVATTRPETSLQAILWLRGFPRCFSSRALRLTPCGSVFPLSNAAHALFYQGALWSLAEKCGSPQRSRLPNMARNLRLLRNLEGTASDEGGGPALGEIPGRHGL